MPRKSVLVVEDEKGLVKLIRYNFEKEGYRVSAAHDGESGLSAARKEKPDLIILDVMMPGMDGFSFCRTLRQESRVPIIFLTAKKSEVDRILGLKLGGDDYVTKPFSIGELLARVEAVLRRSETSGEPGGSVRRFGGLEVDTERYTVRVSGEKVSLSPREYEFLKLLAEADGKVLSRDALLERVWGHDGSMEIDTRTVDQHIARLRRKLKGAGGRIVTVKGAGYRIARE